MTSDSLTIASPYSQVMPYPMGYYPQYSIQQDSTKVEKKEPTPTYRKEEEKSYWAEGIIGTALTIGAAVLCRKAYVKGNPAKGFFERIGDGFVNMWKSGVAKVTGKLKPTQEFSQTTINGKNVFTVPNRTNNIRGAVASEELAKIGADTKAPTLLNISGDKVSLAKGIKIREGEFADAATGLHYKFSKGKLTKLEYGGKNILNSTEPEHIAMVKQAKEQIAKYMKGENLNKLASYKFSHTENGTSRLFTYTQGNKPELKCAASKWFDSSADAVQAYGATNTKAGNALKALAEGKTDGLKIVQAEYVSPTLGTFRIKNGEVVGLTQGGKYFDKTTDRFIAEQAKNPEAFANVLKQEEKDLINVVRVLA